jgi:streptomycin 6-kinase
MTIEELRADNERLTTLNDRLARQVATMADTLDRGRRELLAIGWDAAVAAMVYEDGSKVQVAKSVNPYRQP